jgi:hypothetical protein
MSKAAVVTVVSIDCECDKDEFWRVRRPLEFSNICNGIARVLRPLERDCGYRWTLLISPEVIEDDGAVNEIASLETAELGTHLHSEFVEPCAEWDCEETKLPQSALDRDVEFAKLRRLTERFSERLNRVPKSFRAGRFGYGRFTWESLVRLGYEVDSSVTPWWRQRFAAGEDHDHWGRRPEPFWIRMDTVGDGGKLLEVPVTIGNAALLRWPDWILRACSRSWRLRRLAERCGGGRGVVWLRPLRNSAEEMLELAHVIVDTWRVRTPVVLNMMFHSNELAPGMSPYARSEEDVLRLRHDLTVFAEKLSAQYDVKFCTLAEIRKLWEKNARS